MKIKIMMRIKFIVAAAAVMLISNNVFAQDLNSVIDKYNQAAGLLGEKKWAEAIPALESVIEEGLQIGPDAVETVQNAQKALPQCYYRVGGAYVQAKNWDEAIKNFSKAAELGELYGDLATARNASGWVAKAYTAQAADAFNAEDYAAAAEIFAKGYAADPTNTDLALNLAMSYGEMGDTTNAFKIYREVIALEDRHSKYKEPAQTAREKIGYYMAFDAQKAIEAKDYDAAYAILDRLLEATPNDPVLNMMYLSAANTQKNWKKMIEKGGAAAAAQTDPEKKSDAYFLVGVAYQNTDNKAMAIENYRKVTEGQYLDEAKKQIAELSK